MERTTPPQTTRFPPLPTVKTDASTDTNSYLPSPTTPSSELDSERIFEAYQESTDRKQHTKFGIAKVYAEILFRFILSILRFIWKLTVLIFMSIDNLPLHPRLALLAGFSGLIIYGFFLDPLIGRLEGWKNSFLGNVVVVGQGAGYEMGDYRELTPKETVVLSASPELTWSLFTAAESSSTSSFSSSSEIFTSEAPASSASETSTFAESSSSVSIRRTKTALWNAGSSSSSKPLAATPISTEGWPTTATFTPATILSETYIPLSDVIAMVLTASTVVTWGGPVETFAVPVVTVGARKEEVESTDDKREL
ncbi:hypothetical protein BDZ45DRAFT_693535 [Acephala macrosclerotiorum]|nr:hypothetical protein BDZ45DRAFT_693535 [Acephala macrosclerotiorum]